MSNRWTEKDLELKGLTRNKDGSYSRTIGGVIYNRKSPSDLFTKKELTEKPVSILVSPEMVISPPNASVLTITGLVAGLNGSKGLMQAHWAKNNKNKLLYQTIIAQHLRENKIKQHLGEVTIEYIGYKSRFMDWDNFCASFKLLGDSLTKMKIIVDDNPQIVTTFMPSQIKVKQADQKVVIIIKDR